MSTANSEQVQGAKGDNGQLGGTHSELLKHNSKITKKKIWHFMVTISPIVTVAALVIAIYQSYQAIESEQKITKIADSVSTQYVEVFPQNMPEIIKLLKKTQKKLVVVADVAAYGHFSDPHDSKEYIAELRRLSDPKEKISIEFICYQPGPGNATQKYLKEQFDWAALLNKAGEDSLKAWNIFKEGEAGNEKRKGHAAEFAEYKLYHSYTEPKDMEDLVGQIDKAGEDLLKEIRALKGKETVFITGENLPIFMWIIDGNEAIFSLHTYGTDAREHSFRTTDPRFIAKLYEIEQEAKHHSREYEP